ANGMIENVVATFSLPLGIATNFRINGRDYLIPMVVEEPSVVAAASDMARIARDCAGFETSSSRPAMRPQGRIIGTRDPHGERWQRHATRNEILAAANGRDSVRFGLGGGCRESKVGGFTATARAPKLDIRPLVVVRDAVGANSINSMT